MEKVNEVIEIINRMDTTEQNKVAMYLYNFNRIKNKNMM